MGCGATILVKDGTLFNKLRMERLNSIFRLLNLSGGAFILCHREAFQAVGGFSDSLFAYEEIDFIIRLKRYGRQHGQKFAVLHRHPLVTSGRKEEYHFSSMVILFASNIFALLLFGLHYLLPTKITVWLNRRLLYYWYHRQ